MGVVAQGAQHGVGFFHGLGLVEHLSIDINNGIGRDKHMVSDGLLVMQGFVFCQELTDFFGGLGVVERLIGIDIDILKVESRIAEQLMSAWRLRRQQQFGELGYGGVDMGGMVGLGGIHDGLVGVDCGDVDAVNGFAIVWQRYCDEAEEMSKFVM